MTHNPASAAAFEPRYATRASRMKASEIRELLKLLDQPGIISFAGGIPDPVLFPVSRVQAAYAAALAKPETAARALQYSVSEGDPALRDWIVAHMAKLGVSCTPENIMITSGSQQGLEFLAKMLLSPGDTALVQAPTYLGALQAFSAYEPTYDELGLENSNRSAKSYAEAAAKAGGSVKFAYCVPDFANPTGETMTLAGRQHVLSLARELDIPVIEDCAYSQLRYEGAEMPRLLALDIQQSGSIDASRVIYCGTFSKTLMPGLRVGWVCCAKSIISRLVLVKQASDLHSPTINQSVMVEVANTVYDEQVEKARQHYRTKRDVMLDALSAHMPEGVHWPRPEGGLFVWLQLPTQVNVADLLRRAIAEEQVAFVPGQAFFADGSGANTLRLSFSQPDITAIKEGIERLSRLVKKVLAGQ